MGFLDLWASVDAAFVAEKLTEALARSGSAWRVRSVDPTVEQGPAAWRAEGGCVGGVDGHSVT